MGKRSRNGAEASVGDHKVNLREHGGVGHEAVDDDAGIAPLTAPYPPVVTKSRAWGVAPSTIASRRSSCAWKVVERLTRTSGLSPTGSRPGRRQVRDEKPEAPQVAEGLVNRRIEGGRHHRDRRGVAGEEPARSTDRGNAKELPRLVDRRVEQRPQLAEPHVDERLVHAVQEHDARHLQAFGSGQRTGEVRIDDNRLWPSSCAARTKSLPTDDPTIAGKLSSSWSSSILVRS